MVRGPRDGPASLPAMCDIISFEAKIPYEIRRIVDFWGVNGQQMYLLTTPFTTTFHGQITREESIADLWPIYIRDQDLCKIMEQILPNYGKWTESWCHSLWRRVMEEVLPT